MSHEPWPIEPPPRWSWRFTHVFVAVVISLCVLGVVAGVVVSAFGVTAYS